MFRRLFYSSVQKAGQKAGLTGMADTSVVDFNAHLTSLGGSDLDVLDGQRRTSLPGNSSLSIVQHLVMIHRRELCWPTSYVRGGRIELTLQVIVCGFSSQQGYSVRKREKEPPNLPVLLC